MGDHMRAQWKFMGHYVHHHGGSYESKMKAHGSLCPSLWGIIWERNESSWVTMSIIMGYHMITQWKFMSHYVHHYGVSYESTMKAHGSLVHHYGVSHYSTMKAHGSLCPSLWGITWEPNESSWVTLSIIMGCHMRAQWKLMGHFAVNLRSQLICKQNIGIHGLKFTTSC